MTDRPKTMLLGAHEWRTLVMTGATNLYTLFQSLSSEVPTAEQTKWFHDQLDRLKMQVSAWGASGQTAAPVPEQPAMTDYLNQIQNGSGTVTAAEPKKKRGWQKGRKRGPRKPKQGEAVQ